MSQKDNLKRILQIKNNPQGAVLNAIQDMKEETRKAIEKMKEDNDKKIERAIANIEQKDPVNSGFIEKIVSKITTNLVGNTKGDTGKQGESVKGDKGDRGDNGNSVKGDKGDSIKGDKGDNIKGDKGDKGDRGDFIKGDDGKDGSPDEPKEIAKKLNTLEKEVDRKVIKGIDDEFLKIRKEISNVKREKGGGGGGGGMGNPQHQVFNISSGTTTVTTTFPIAAQGNAIMNFTYENARLELTNHYTVGSDRKTITFNSDVQAQFRNSTTAAITYIRG